MSNDKVLLVVHANIVLYALCFWLTNPVLPYLLKEHGATSLSFGYFQALFNVVQLFGGLLVGDLQDRYSGSTALSITQIGSAAVYGLMFSAHSLDLLYLSRIPTILQQSMQVAQACVSKASEGETRTVSLGRLSLSYSAGMVVGSLLSGRIAEHFGNRAPALIAFGLSVLIVIVNKFTLGELATVEDDANGKKDDDGKKGGEKGKEKEKPKVRGGLRGYLKLVLDLKKVVIFLALMFSTRSLYEPVYSLTLLEKFEVKQSTMGTLMSAFAGIGFVSNVILLPALLKVVSEPSLTKTAIASAAACYGLLAVLPADFYTYIGVFCLMTLASAMLYTLSTSYISRCTSKSVHGQAIALSHSLRSVVGIGCPVAGTYLLSTFGGGSVAALNCGLLVLSAAMA